MTPLSRSEQMSRIRGRDTKPEVLLRTALVGRDLVPDDQASSPVGRPDISFRESRVAVFVDGCFWHGCPDHHVRPRSRADFWATKLVSNVDRDRRQTLALETLGWTVVRIWECRVRESVDEAVAEVVDALEGRLRPGQRWCVERVEEVDSQQRIERRHLVDLRDAAATRVVEGRRSTRKRGRRGEGD